MAIPDPSKAGSPFSPLQTGGWNPETPEIDNFFIPLFSFRRGYDLGGLGWPMGGPLGLNNPKDKVVAPATDNRLSNFDC